MNGRLPLPTLLSHALVAFTIEFDNEFEHRVPHRTTNHGSTGSRSSPWLVSMVMWLMFMRFVPGDGIAVRELQELTGFNDKEMRTWFVSHGKVVGLCRRRRAGSVGQLFQPLGPQLGGPPHSGRPEGAGSLAAIDGHYRETLARTVREGRHLSPSRIIPGAGRQLRRRSA